MQYVPINNLEKEMHSCVIQENTEENKDLDITINNIDSTNVNDVIT